MFAFSLKKHFLKEALERALADPLRWLCLLFTPGVDSGLWRLRLGRGPVYLAVGPELGVVAVSVIKRRQGRLVLLAATLIIYNIDGRSSMVLSAQHLEFLSRSVHNLLWCQIDPERVGNLNRFADFSGLCLDDAIRVERDVVGGLSSMIGLESFAHELHHF